MSLRDLHLENISDLLRFCESVDSAGVLLPNGEIILVDKWFLSRSKPNGTGHLLFDAVNGILTDGYKKQRVDSIWTAWTSAYSPKGFMRLLRHPAMKKKMLIAALLGAGCVAAISALEVVLPADSAAPAFAFGAFLTANMIVIALALIWGVVAVRSKTRSVKREPSTLGGFEGGSLMFREADLAEYLEEHQTADAQPATVASVARKIVKECKYGTPPTKAVARARFGKGMSVRRFDDAWRRAAEEFPRLSKPGKRPRK